MGRWPKWQRMLSAVGLLGLLLGLVPPSGAALAQEWSIHENVSNSSSVTRYGAVSSSDAWDQPVVTYLENENPADPNDLRLRAKVRQSSGWSSGQLIMEAQFLSDQEAAELLGGSGDAGVLDVYAGVSYWQPRQASDSNGKIHVVVSPRDPDNGNASAVKYVRIKKGDTGLPQKEFGPKRLSALTSKHAGFAQIAVNPDNDDIYVVYLQYDGPAGYVVRSTDGGNTWTTGSIKVVNEVQGYAGITVQAAGGKVVVAWGDGARRVRAKVVNEADFNQAGFDAAPVESLSGGTGGCTGISSAVSPSGKIYVACAMRADTVANSYISVSVYDPTTGQWTAKNVPAAQGNRTVHRAVVAVDGAETVWLAWDNDSSNRELRATAGHVGGSGNWVEDTVPHTVAGRGEFPVAYYGPNSLAGWGFQVVSMKDSDVWYHFRQTAQPSCDTAKGDFSFEGQRDVGGSLYTNHNPNALGVSWCSNGPNPTTKMQFKVDGSPVSSDPVDVATPYTVTLGFDGQREVVAEFSTEVTPTTSTVTHTVYLDTQPPSMDLLTVSKGTGSSSNPKDVLAQDGTYVATRYSKVRVTLNYHDDPKDGYASEAWRVWATQGTPDLDTGGPWRKWPAGTVTQTVENFWSLFAYGGSGTNVVRTIYAAVEDKAGNLSNVVSGTIFVDRKPPTGTLTICTEDGSTCNISSTSTPTVTLQLDAFDNAASYAQGLGKPKVAKFRLRNSGDLWTDWMWYDDSYATVGYKWRVGPFKTNSRLVQVQFMDYAGYTSPAYSKRIYLDPSLVDKVRPTGSITIYDEGNNNELSPLGTSTTATVTLHLDPTDNYAGEPALPTVRYYRLRNAGGRWTGWLPFPNQDPITQTWRLQQGSSGRRAVYVQFMDWAGNISPTYVNTAVFSDTVPPGVAITLDGGAITTSDRKVDVGFVVTDANPIIKVRIANGDQLGPKWSFTTKSLNPDDPKVLGWTLTSGAGQKWVWAKVQDWGLNWSDWVSATITYNP